MPTSSLLQQALMLFITLGAAIALPLLIVGSGNMNERLGAIIRELDQFALNHKPKKGEAMIYRPTLLGSAFSLSLIVVVLSLAISMLISFVEDNAALNTVFAPSASAVTNIDMVHSDVVFALSAVMPLGYAASAAAACPAAPDALTVLDSANANGTWTVAATEASSGYSQATAQCSYTATCVGCTLAVTQSTRFVSTLPHSAQSVAWSLLTERAWAADTRNYPKYSMVSGSTHGSAAGALTGATWGVSVVRETLEDERDDSYEYGYILALSSSDVSVASADRATTGYVPALSGVRVEVDVDVGVSASTTVITAELSLVALIGALGGLFGGIAGAYRALFPKVEDALQRALSDESSKASGKQWLAQFKEGSDASAAPAGESAGSASVSRRGSSFAGANPVARAISERAAAEGKNEP